MLGGSYGLNHDLQAEPGRLLDTLMAVNRVTLGAGLSQRYADRP